MAYFILDHPPLKLTGRIMCLLLLFAFSMNTQASTDERALKTAIVFKLFRFVSWPDEHRQRELRLCVSQQDPYFPLFEAMATRQTNAAGVRLAAISSLAEKEGCDVAFRSSGSAQPLRQWLDTLRTQAVLTISDEKLFAENGGMINLLVEHDRVAFKINIAAAKAADITIQSPLLKLAHIVGKTSPLSEQVAKQ